MSYSPIRFMKLPKQLGSLRSILLATVCLAGMSWTSIQAQSADEPKPSAEQKKLEIFVGEWEYQGGGKETPLGPGGKFTGREVSKMILNGFFVESQWKDKAETGYSAEGIVMRWYDSTTKTFRETGFENDGSASPGTSTVSGNTWTTTGTRADKQGKSYQVKFTTTFSADGKSGTTKAEYSADSKIWMPWWDLTMKKVK